MRIRGQMIIGDDSGGAMKLEPSDIDLKCAEKVTDSDNEEVHAHDACDESKQSIGASGGDGNNAAHATSDKNQSRDFTCKPKAIKAQRQIDNALLSYQQIPLYAFNSPKNPTGILPFQPTGKGALRQSIKIISNSEFIASSSSNCGSYFYANMQAAHSKRCR